MISIMGEVGFQSPKMVYNKCWTGGGGGTSVSGVSGIPLFYYCLPYHYGGGGGKLLMVGL